MKQVFLGVDGGNSKTAALACLATGEVIGAARSGCGDIYGVAGEPQAVEAVLAAAGGALSEAGVARAQVVSAASGTRPWRGNGPAWPGPSSTTDTPPYGAASRPVSASQ
jgi:N-acetylglucosamine kinase-like BadF-type ATPase